MPELKNQTFSSLVEIEIWTYFQILLLYFFCLTTFFLVLPYRPFNDNCYYYLNNLNYWEHYPRLKLKV